MSNNKLPYQALLVRFKGQRDSIELAKFSGSHEGLFGVELITLKKIDVHPAIPEDRIITFQSRDWVPRTESVHVTFSDLHNMPPLIKKKGSIDEEISNFCIIDQTKGFFLSGKDDLILKLTKERDDCMKKYKDSLQYIEDLKNKHTDELMQVYKTLSDSKKDFEIKRAEALGKRESTVRRPQ